jgi:hypothetical protein
MVQFLNAPQAQPFVREDPTLAAFARFAQTMMGQMAQNKQLRQTGQLESQKQVQELATKFIGQGATPEQAYITAMQMVSRPQPMLADKPMMANQQIGPFNVPMPHLGNIGENIWSRFATPQYQAPEKIIAPKFRGQKTLGELGINLPKEIGWLSRMIPTEVDKMDQVIKWAMLSSKGLLGGAGRQYPGAAINPTIWEKAKALAEDELASDFTFIGMQIDDPGLADIIRTNKIRGKYDQMVSGEIGKEKPTTDKSNPLGLKKPPK